MKPENVDDFLEDKWLAERGVGYRMVVTEEQKGDDMSESSIKQTSKEYQYIDCLSC